MVVSKETKDHTQTPADQAIERAGKGGIVPPKEHRWKPGESGNPKGRPNAGASVREWMNVMQDWNQQQLKAVLDDADTPAHKCSAARCWLDAISMDRTKGGMPVAGPDMERIISHTDGTAVKRSETRIQSTVDVGTLLSEADCVLKIGAANSISTHEEA